MQPRNGRRRHGRPICRMQSQCTNSRRPQYLNTPKNCRIDDITQHVVPAFGKRWPAIDSFEKIRPHGDLVLDPE